MTHPMAVRPDADEPIRMVHDHELLTVDVWDTLLRRRCHPDCVKLHVCRFLLINSWSDLSEDRRDLWTLLRLRQQAEKELGDSSRSRGLDDEYRHLDVYRRWLELAGLSSCSSGEQALQRLLEALEQIEVAQEKYVSYVDPTIAEHLSRHSARRVLFLSDFYLSASAIRELVAHHRIDHLVEDGVVSCDVGLNKRSGRLFRYLHEHLGIDPKRHLHMGDNLHADVHPAEHLGVSALHYLPEREHALREQREAAFHRREESLRRIVAGGAMTASEGDHDASEAYAHGRKWALLLIGFVLDIMERAVADRLEQLYFFTREGEFFLALYRRLSTQDILGFPVPPARLLHVSRLATFAGTLREFSTGELMRMWNQYSVQSLHAFFKSLDMAPEDFRGEAERHHLTLDVPITYPWSDPRVIAFLGDAEVLRKIEPRLAEKRKLLMAYLSQSGLSGRPARVGIVDIGWRGTIQDNLAYALPEVTWHGYYLALNRFLNAQPENSQKRAFGPNLNASDQAKELLDFVAPIEMLCNSPNGSVTGYQWLGNEATPSRHVDAEENRIFHAYVRDFQQGVLDSVPDWAAYIRTHAYSTAEIRPVALEIWRGIIQRPPTFLAEAYFQLNHNETFGVGGFHDKRNRLTTFEVLMALVSRTARVRLQRYLSEVGWLPGMLVCSETSAAFRWSLRLVLQLREWRNRMLRRGQ